MWKKSITPASHVIPLDNKVNNLPIIEITQDKTSSIHVPVNTAIAKIIRISKIIFNAFILYSYFLNIIDNAAFVASFVVSAVSNQDLISFANETSWIEARINVTMQNASAISNSTPITVQNTFILSSL